MAIDRPALAQVHEEMPDWVDGHLRDLGKSWRQLERGELDYSLADLQWYLISSDPVRFGECHFVERPKDGGGKWRFFDDPKVDQKASLRHRGDVINKSAAGVGKTRELATLVLWGLTCRVGDSLVVGNKDGTLDLLFALIMHLREKSSWLAEQIPESGIRLTPYRSIVGRSGNRIDFRPTGHDGEPLRANHVNNFLLGDEVAKWHSRKIFNEFWSRAHHGCEIRLYSVPDGVMTSEFAQLSRLAVPLAQATPAAGPVDDVKKRKWALVQWRKPDLPPPHWSVEIEGKLELQYRGKETNGYRQNVFGEDGDPEESVFPYETFSRRLRALTDYRKITLSRDPGAGVFRLELARINPLAPLDAGTRSTLTAPLIVEHQTEIPLGDFKAGALVRSLVGSRQGHFVGGIDYGASQSEPSEVLLWEVLGPLLRGALRLKLAGIDYSYQRQIVAALHEGCDLTYGWGLDATGVGSAAHHELAAEIGHDPLSGFVWNARCEARSPRTGETVEDPISHQPRSVSLKEQATQLLEYRVTEGLIEIPADPDFPEQFCSHTAKSLPSGERRFAKFADHVIDASRAAALRHFYIEHEASQPQALETAAFDPRRGSFGGMSLPPLSATAPDLGSVSTSAPEGCGAGR